VPAAILCPCLCSGPQRKRSQMSKRSRISGPFIPYGLFRNKGETCAKFGSDRFRNVNLYKFHTNKQTNKHSSLYTRLARCPPLTLTLPSGYPVFYIPDAQLFPRPQLVPHGEPRSEPFTHLQQVHYTLGDTTGSKSISFPVANNKR
jgi:hypothetical protein